MSEAANGGDDCGDATRDGCGGDTSERAVDDECLAVWC